MTKIHLFLCRVEMGIYKNYVIIVAIKVKGLDENQ
jgi:hypothetical protein